MSKDDSKFSGGGFDLTGLESQIDSFDISFEQTLQRPPNVDLSTVETIECGDYRVRVGGLFDGRYYAAVVAMRNTRPIYVAMTKLTQGGDGEWMTVDETTHEAHAQKYVAIGTAIESFLDMGEDDDTA